MLGIKNTSPLETHAPTPPWEEEPDIIIHSHITNIESKSKYLDLELKELTCTYLDKNFPGEEWIRVYTDGSAEKAVANGGSASGVYIEMPDQKTKAPSPLVPTAPTIKQSWKPSKKL